MCERPHQERKSSRSSSWGRSGRLPRALPGLGQPKALHEDTAAGTGLTRSPGRGNCLFGTEKPKVWEDTALENRESEVMSSISILRFISGPK